MQSKNKRAMTVAERVHVGRVKMLCCSVCDAHGPSDAHHIEQNLHFCVVSLCRSCHNGLHGDKSVWKVMKMDELKALNVTIGRLVNGNKEYDR